MTQHPTNVGMRVFTFIWFGQMVSLIGSGLTNFALGVWVYQQTGSVTQFALVSLFTSLPTILLSPIAGAIVDNLPRRQVMIVSDLGAGISTAAIAFLFASNHLSIWHIYLATALSSCFSAIQWPAYTAATATIVPEQHLGRANGMVQLGEAAARLISPMLAGVLLISIQLRGIIFIDFVTFIFALVVLLLVRFPKRIVDRHRAEKTSLFKELTYGFTYILNRGGLLGLLVFFAITNFLVGVVQVLVTPLVLSFASPAALGTILTIGGLGMLVGSVVISIFKGPQRRIESVFGFMLLGGLCIMAAGWQKSVHLLAVIAFLFFFGQPIINSSTLIIFQKKVASNVQGRVFALISAIANASLPFAYAIASLFPLGFLAIGLPLYFVLETNPNFRLKVNNQAQVPATVPVKKPVNQSIAALGRIQTKDKIINLSGPSSLDSARISQVLVKEGEKVRRGQVVAILDNVSQLQAALDKAKLDVKVAQAQLTQVKAGTVKQGEVAAQQARIADLQAQFQGTVTTQKANIARLQAEYRNAQTQYSRFESLYKQGAISAVDNDTRRLAVDTSQAQLNEAKATLNQTLSSFPNQIKEAKASLDKLKEIRPVDVQVAQRVLEKAIASVPEAQANLSWAYIKAPISGQILKINTFPGETISEKGIVDLAQTQQMYVVAEIYETDIGKIKLGQKATISSRALAKDLTGTVDTIGVQIGKKNVFNNDPTLDIDSRIVEVKIRLDPADIADAANLINLQVDVKIPTNTTNNKS